MNALCEQINNRDRADRADNNGGHDLPPIFFELVSLFVQRNGKSDRRRFKEKLNDFSPVIIVRVRKTADF